MLDLRNNGGGSLAEATELTGLFIDEGPGVQVRNAQGRVEVERDRRPGQAWEGPLAVLVNRVSASASEIFAAAMQDYGRALVIGEPTYGKGTVQNLISLDHLSGRDGARHGQLKFTIAQFFRINGSSTQLKGVVPDIQFPVTLDAEDYGESVYDNALPWAQIEPADFETIAELGAIVPQLQSVTSGALPTVQSSGSGRRTSKRSASSASAPVSRCSPASAGAERDSQEQRRLERRAPAVSAGPGRPDSASQMAAQGDDGLQADERSVAEEPRARKRGRAGRRGAA